MVRHKKSIKARYRELFYVIAISLIMGFLLGLAVNPNNIKTIRLIFDEKEKTDSFLQNDPVLVGASEIDICFTPPSGCASVIARHIFLARESIYVQAYGITSNEVVEQLIAAHNRGVKVRVLLDKSNFTNKYSKMQQMAGSGIEVSIDRVPGIAHNKVMIIDQSKVITGSFNFTKSADSRNTENVIIVNDQSVASKYLQNWLSRKSRNETLTILKSNPQAQEKDNAQ